MAEGRLFIGSQAIDAGLVDGMSTMEEMTAPKEDKGLQAMQDAVRGVNPLASPLAAVRIEASLSHNSTVADSEPKWADVDKTKLPRNAFADQGDPAKKSTWGYPHHWVKDGKVGDEGVYTSGTMYLHREGLNAAWAAANGARSGQKASQAVINHLQEHRRALGLDKDKPKGEFITMDINELKESCPETYQAVLAEGMVSGAQAERDRIKAIQALPSHGHKDLVTAAIEDGSSTAGDVALAIMKKEEAVRTGRLGDMLADSVKPAVVAETADVSEEQIQAQNNVTAMLDYAKQAGRA
jgi:hypothetical protein